MSDSKHISDEQLQFLSDLQSLVEEQIELSHHGNISGVERLFKQTTALVAKIADCGILQSPELREQRKQLQKLYEDLHLAVAAQRAKASDELSHIRKGRKTLQTYRSNI